MRIPIALSGLAMLLAACGEVGMSKVEHTPGSEYLATVSAEAADERMSRDPFALAAATPRSQTEPFVLTGRVNVIAYNDARSSSAFVMGGIKTPGAGMDDCMGVFAYEDMQEGAPVIIRHSTGRVLGTGKLGRGSAGTLSGGPPGSDLERLGQDALTCTFTFRVGGLPRAEAYTVEVAGRGEVTYSATKLQRLGGEIYLALSP